MSAGFDAGHEIRREGRRRHDGVSPGIERDLDDTPCFTGRPREERGAATSDCSKIKHRGLAPRHRRVARAEPDGCGQRIPRVNRSPEAHRGTGRGPRRQEQQEGGEQERNRPIDSRSARA